VKVQAIVVAPPRRADRIRRVDDDERALSSAKKPGDGESRGSGSHDDRRRFQLVLLR